jgi:uncharacterized protein (TIGR03083 family)
VVQALWTAGKWLHDKSGAWRQALQARSPDGSGWPARAARGVRRADRYLVRGLQLIWPPARRIDLRPLAPPGRDALLGLGDVPDEAIQRLIREADRAGYLSHLAQESARFATVLTAIPAQASFPALPGWTARAPWTADDLLWHLAEQYWFWLTVVRDGHSGAEAAELVPGRPAGRGALLEFYEQASDDLQKIFTALAPESVAWSWAPEQTAGFVCRRLTHETLIHRIDAELAAGTRTAMDPGLCADGVDEALRLMFSAWPEAGRFAASRGQTLRLRATDTGGTWFIALGTLLRAGTAPAASPAIQVAEADVGGEAAAVVRGRAADLDCWLWRRRPAGPLHRSGDQAVLLGFESVVSSGTTDARLRGAHRRRSA